jgi:hypothetical protein
MDFTPEQIAIIEKIVDSKLIAMRVKKLTNKPKPKPKPYHSIPQIRDLISKNIDDLKAELGEREFDINVFRFVLQKYTILTEEDLKIVSNGQVRWDVQVGNALIPHRWTEVCPIKTTSRAGKLKFTTNQLTFAQ